MKNKTLLEIYAMSVCFFSLACFVITLGIAIWNIVEISAPEFVIPYEDYKCHLSDEAYIACYSDDYEYTRRNNPLPFPTGEALTAKRTANLAQMLKTEQREATQDLFKKIIVLLISAIVFIIHWKISVRIRKEYNQQ